MKKIFIFLIFCFQSYLTIAQGEANNWFFGQRAGLNFSSGEPTILTGSKLNTTEGCATFSDSNGDLLFYTDGTSVWDKNHDYMPSANNTLKGNSSSTQSAIIVPHPGDDKLFYIFTVGATFNNVGEFGFYGYKVDMTKNNGLGDIDGAAINLMGAELNYNWSEKVTSVKGSECNTFWVISLVNNKYYSYKIDEEGLDTTPITSTVSHNVYEKRGYLKASPDGKYIASATFTQYYDREEGVNVIGDGKLYLYSFNDETGEVSNDGISLIQTPEKEGAPYGVEFSSNSSKLYTATYDGSINQLYQFDLSKRDIIASKYLVNSQSGYRGGLQLAPNGKIYATIPSSYGTGTKYLQAINLPDLEGVNCQFQKNAVDLGTGRAMQGLPPFIASLLLPIEIKDENTSETITNQTLKLCTGSDYKFSTPVISGSPTYIWKFNNEIIEGETFSSIELTNIELTNEGTYSVKVELIDECGSAKTYSGKFNVQVFNPPSKIDTIVYEQCDIDESPTDYKTIFNLSSKLEEIINDVENIEVFFYKNETDFNNNRPIVNIEEYTGSHNDEIIIQLVNSESGCSTISKMELKVYSSGLDKYNAVYTCEINNPESEFLATKSTGTGLGLFDFDEIKKTIYETLSNDPTLEVQLYKNSQDAQLQSNPLIGLLELKNMLVYVRISNKTTQNCVSSGVFNLIVNPIPTPNGNTEKIILCVNNPKDNPQLFTVDLYGNTGVSGDTYQWFLNNQTINGATEAIYEANKEGTYKVEAYRNYPNSLATINDDNSCSGYNTFTVIESNKPNVKPSDVIVFDDRLINSISINTENLGIGNYEFTIGSTSNYTGVFDDVKSGIHTIYIRDTNGCGMPVSIEISVLEFPKYFTPNNDGDKDSWNIFGISPTFYTSAIVYIYDRYGKLIAKIDNQNSGWDGTFNGKPLPPTDYWFSSELTDTKGITRLKKGHFSLLR